MKKKLIYKILIVLAIFTLIITLILSLALKANTPISLDKLNDNDMVTLRVKGSANTLKLEVAASTSKLEEGLMNRTSLPEESGMIFIFKNMEQETFWMKDTLIPLDMIFLDDNLKVVKIYENTKINQTSEVYPSIYPCKYVIESNTGWVSSVKLDTNSQFEII